MILTPHQEAMIDIGRVAFFKGASDIHIEPSKNGADIRFRIDGVLQKIRSLETEKAALFIEQTKQLLGFDMGVLNLPQDSRWAHPSVKADFRCNIQPIIHGEKICLRLLEREKKFSLEKYQLIDSAKSYLLKVMRKKSGLMILSGQTGSGKSTLLYSILGSIDRDRLNVCTVEDPVEYELDGLNQSQTDEKRGYDFSDALRALMRQDPDVIMVGEIRDIETAKAAIHAASTGHLVLTTVHANDSEDIFARLSGLGVAREPVESALLFASSQKLAKKLCKNCKEEAPEQVGLLTSFFNKTVDFMPFKVGKGCSECDFRGISGRTLLFEFLKKTEEKDQRKIAKVGNIREQAFDLVKKGEISADEAYAQFN